MKCTEFHPFLIDKLDGFGALPIQNSSFSALLVSYLHFIPYVCVSVCMDASMDVVLFASYSNADGNIFQLNARWFVRPFARIVSCQTTNPDEMGE